MLYNSPSIRLRPHSKSIPCKRNKKGEYKYHKLGCGRKEGYILLGDNGKFAVLAGYSAEHAHAFILGKGYILSGYDDNARYYSKSNIVVS